MHFGQVNDHEHLKKGPPSNKTCTIYINAMLLGGGSWLWGLHSIELLASQGSGSIHQNEHCQERPPSGFPCLERKSRSALVPVSLDEHGVPTSEPMALLPIDALARQDQPQCHSIWNTEARYMTYTGLNSSPQ